MSQKTPPPIHSPLVERLYSKPIPQIPAKLQKRKETHYDSEIRELIFLLKICLGFLAGFIGMTLAVML